MAEDHKMVVLVTGGSGMVGHAIQELVNGMEKRPHEEFIFVSSKDADLTNKNDAVQLFERVRPTHVIHLASKVGGLFGKLRAHLDFYKINTNIDENLFTTAQEFGVKKVVSSLSTGIFSATVKNPIDETMLHEGPPHEANFGNSYARRMIDVQNRAYKEKFGSHFTSVMPTNIFGPHDNFNLEDGHLLPGLIHKAYLAKRDNTPFVIWGTGTPLRQFIYAKDVARLYLWALRDYPEIDTIILSEGEESEISIDEVAGMIIKATGFTGPVTHDTSIADGQHRKTTSNRKLRKYLPDFVFTPLKQAIQETCDWLNDNYDTARK